MKKYYYRAKDWGGKSVRGEIEAVSRQNVLESIKSSGLIPLEVLEKEASFVSDLSSKFLSRIGLKQISGFTRQLSTMMTAGLALTDALSLLRQQMVNDRMMYEVVDNALNSVRGGLPLGTALEKYTKYFGTAYVASIKAGEEGGVLEEVLSKLAKNLEDQSEFNGKVKGAMIYPVIVIAGMFIVMFIMMVFVIPKLTSLYSDFGSKMPAITLALMAVSGLAVKFWFLFPLIPLVTFMILRAGDKNPQFREKRDGLLLKFPIIGELTMKTVLSNTCRTLSMMLSAGISLVDGLKIVADVSGNEVYKNAFLKIAERVEKGFTIADSFAEHEAFPIIINQMVATGEATGKLDEVLLKVSDYFATESEQSVKSLTTAIEPLIMIVLGIGVGFLVVAVIMPIYDLTSQF